MRSLIFLLLAAVASSLFATQVEQQVYSQASLRRFGSIEQKKSYKIRKTGSLTKIELLNRRGLLLNSEFKLERLDYSTYTIRQLGGNEISLKELGQDENELFFTQRANWQKGRHEIDLSLFGHLTPSPFRQRGGTFLYGHKLNQSLSKIYISGLYFTQQMPFNSYIDHQFQEQVRARKVIGQQLELGVEQILSEKNKIKLNTFLGEKKNERPPHWGVGGEYAHGLRDDLFAKAKMSYIKERKDQKLLDERGYFDYLRTGFSLTYEPVFDLLLSGSYSFLRERESDPRLDSAIQVGSDTFGLGVEALFNGWTMLIKGSYSLTNTDESTQYYVGGVRWQL
jgi:hypothetical protein